MGDHADQLIEQILSDGIYGQDDEGCSIGIFCKYCYSIDVAWTVVKGGGFRLMNKDRTLHLCKEYKKHQIENHPAKKLLEKIRNGESNRTN